VVSVAVALAAVSVAVKRWRKTQDTGHHSHLVL